MQLSRMTVISLFLLALVCMNCQCTDDSSTNEKDPLTFGRGRALAYSLHNHDCILLVSVQEIGAAVVDDDPGLGEEFKRTHQVMRVKWTKALLMHDRKPEGEYSVTIY